MTRAELKASTRKELAALAKVNAVPGWHAMRKEELIDVLARIVRRKNFRIGTQHSGNGSAVSNRSRNLRVKETGKTGRDNGHPGHSRRSGELPDRRATGYRRPRRLAAQKLNDDDGGTDQLILDVQDSHWLHVRWILSESILQRAEAALGPEWHQAVPVLRVYDVTVTEGEESLGTNAWVCDVEIYGDADHWFIPVENAPRSFRVQIGYLSGSGKFFSLTRSHKVTTPRTRSLGRPFNSSANRSAAAAGQIPDAGPSSAGSLSADSGLLPARSNGSSAFTDSGTNAGEQSDNVEFHIDAELLIHGRAHPQSKLTLLGEPVSQADDGSFSLRLALEEGRQIIPAVMLAPDGNEQRTIILAIERNTKCLEPRLMNELL